MALCTEDHAKDSFDDLGLDLHHMEFPKVAMNNGWAFVVKKYDENKVRVHAQNGKGVLYSFIWEKG